MLVPPDAITMVWYSVMCVCSMCFSAVNYVRKSIQKAVWKKVDIDASAYGRIEKKKIIVIRWLILVDMSVDDDRYD